MKTLRFKIERTNLTFITPAEKFSVVKFFAEKNSPTENIIQIWNF